MILNWKQRPGNLQTTWVGVELAVRGQHVEEAGGLKPESG